MNNYFILFGLIISVILIDFIVKKIRNRNKNKKTEISITAKRALTSLFLFTLLSWMIIHGWFWYDWYEFINLFENSDEAENFIGVLDIILLVSFVLLLILNFKKILKNIKDLYNWISKRKRNISLFFVSIIPLKIIIHFLFFTDESENRLRNIYQTDYLDFYHHFLVAFENELWIYYLVAFFLCFFSWYFNNDIEAR